MNILTDLLDDKKVIKNKGMPFYRDSMSHGNLCVMFEVEFPKRGELKPEQVAALKKVCVFFL